MRSRGFSLLEILVVLGIFVLLLGIGMVNYRGGARKASPQSLATIVVGELQAARTRAIQGHTFVALEFPSNGQGSCQSFSRWEGLSKAIFEVAISRVNFPVPRSSLVTGLSPAAVSPPTARPTVWKFRGSASIP